MMNTEEQWAARRKIDQICDQFEAELQRGSKPDIERYLQSESSARIHELAFELVGLEIHYRRQAGEKPNREEYLQRFSEFQAEVTRVFELTSERLDGEDTDIDPSERTRVDHATTQTETKDFLQSDGFGDHRLVHKLGSGGMGVVYLARHRLADREVALKVVKPELLALDEPDKRDDLGKRFRMEAQSVAKLKHPHIVPIFDVGESTQGPYYTMEYIDGPTVSDLLKQTPLAPRVAAQYCVKIAQAVQYAHEHDVIHRDIKPSNILINGSGEPFIVDFGMVKLMGQPGQTLTEFGLGTPAYMSPEQISTDGMITERTDVYGIGATLYAMLTGRPPFQAADPMATLRQVVERPAVSPCQANDEIPQDLDTICLKCLDKSPQARYPTAKALAEDLEAFLDGRPIRARPVSVLEKCRRWCVRHPAIASLSAALFVAVLSGVLGIYWQWRQAVANLEVAQQKEQLANENLAYAHSAVNDFFTLISEDVLLNEPGAQQLRVDLLQFAKAYYEELIQSNKNRPELEFEVAVAQFRIARVMALIDPVDEVIAAFEKSTQLLEAYVMKHPDDRNAKSFLARSVGNLGIFQRRAKTVDRKSEQLSTAIENLQRAVDLQTSTLEEDSPAAQIIFLAKTQNSLGLALRDNGEMDSAENEFQLAIELFEDLEAKQELTISGFTGWAGAMNNFANLLKSRKQFQQSEMVFTKAEQKIGPISDANPRLATLRDKYLMLVGNKAVLYKEWGKWEAALSAYDHAADGYQLLTQANPDVYGYFDRLGLIYYHCSVIAKQQGFHDRYLEYLRRANDTFQRMSRFSGKWLAVEKKLWAILQLLCDEYERRNEPSPAIEVLSQALELKRGEKNGESVWSASNRNQIQLRLARRLLADRQTGQATEVVDLLLSSEELTDQTRYRCSILLLEAAKLVETAERREALHQQSARLLNILVTNRYFYNDARRAILKTDLDRFGVGDIKIFADIRSAADKFDH